jgi:hypothetical protein
VSPRSDESVVSPSELLLRPESDPLRDDDPLVSVPAGLPLTELPMPEPPDPSPPDPAAPPPPELEVCAQAELAAKAVAVTKAAAFAQLRSPKTVIQLCAFITNTPYQSLKPTGRLGISPANRAFFVPGKAVQTK